MNGLDRLQIREGFKKKSTKRLTPSNISAKKMCYEGVLKKRLTSKKAPGIKAPGI